MGCRTTKAPATVYDIRHGRASQRTIERLFVPTCAGVIDGEHVDLEVPRWGRTRANNGAV